MSINIKKSKRGTLHEALGVPKGEKIPVSKLKDKLGDSSSLKKKKVFARNARKWNHAQEGISLPNEQQIQDADDEMFRRFQQEQMLRNQNSVPISNVQYSDMPVTQGLDLQPISEDITREYKENPFSYDGRYGNMALSGLLGVDALIQKRKQPSQVVRPLNSYNENPYGTGSRALAQAGASVPIKFNKPYVQPTYDEMQSSTKTLKQDAVNENIYLNPQQQYFYNALKNPSDNISDIYRGFNEELIGFGSDSSRSIHPNSSPFTGTYLLNNEDKSLLQNEYVNFSKKFKGDKQRYFKDLQKRGVSDSRINNLIPAASFALNQTYEMGGKVSNSGYKANSSDRWEPNLTIPSNRITMNNVPHPVLGVDNTGYQQLMFPGNDYEFPGEYVNETPLRRYGGKLKKKCKNGGSIKNQTLKYIEGETYNLSDDEIKSLLDQGYELDIH